MNLLQRLVFSLPHGEADGLAYRGAACRTPEGITFQESLSFTSFFNAFPARVWHARTNVRHVAVRLSGRGTVDVSLCAQRHDNTTFILQTARCRLEAESVTALSVSLKPEYENLFLTLEAVPSLSGLPLLTQGGFYTPTAPQNLPRLAIVICTYRREEALQRNVDTLLRLAATWPLPHRKHTEPFHIFVVDNDGNLHLENHPCLTLLHNTRNVGGAGGFARGMLAVHEHNRNARERFSHILLMDDDVVFEQDIVLRLHILLQYLKENSICVTGSMLRMEQPEIIHEWGAQVCGLPLCLSGGLSLYEKQSYILPEQKPDYGAWTFFCYPAHEHILPLPCFFRYDDCEFGLRMRSPILRVTGIGVWHHAFLAQSPVHHYYTTRNSIIVNLIYRDDIKKFIFYILFSILYNILLLRYDIAEGIILGVREARISPHQLLHFDNSSLIERLKKTEIPLVGNNVALTLGPPRVPPHLSLLHKIAIILTLNGHLLPQSPSPRLVNIRHYNLASVFRASEVIYHDKETGVMRIARRSVRHCFSCAVRGIIAICGVFLRQRHTAKAWKNAHPHLTSADVWKQYLDL